MDYYKFHIGDYRRKTSHLTVTEHGIYRALIDTYYLTENPLSLDLDSLMRSHCVRTEDEKSAFDNVIKEFFVLSVDGYEHAHCKEHLSFLYDKSEKARRAAKARWLKTKDINIAGDADALQTDSECSADGMLPTTPNPLPTKKNIAGETPACPHTEIIKTYHDILPELRGVRVWSDKRKTHLQKRWRENKDHQNLDFWGKLFRYISTSKFLMGEQGFKCDLEWIVNESNFIKIIEGKYHE